MNGMICYHKKIDNLFKILKKSMRQRKSIYKEKMDAARVEVKAFLNTLTAQTTIIQQ
jgi:hypothetical protein